jgi:uncharacterized membrane protein
MRHLISFFLLLSFIAYLAVPTVIAYIDNSVTISIVHSAAEEEQNGKERNFSDQNKKITNSTDLNFLSFVDFLKKSTIETSELKLAIVYFDLHLPPPELS